ncbi:MAG: N-acetylglucosamine-6-phosphate deacetylase [Verrucomicrobiota bacterium]
MNVQSRMIYLRDDQIVGIDRYTSVRPNKTLFIAPLLFDPQINGYGGVDFQQDNLSAQELHRAVCSLQRDACGRFFFTLITDDWDRMLERLAHVRCLRAASPELARAIAGWHLEGPFLSPEPGYHGAHNPSLMLDPKPAHLRQLRRVAGNDPVLLTIAPERKGAIAAIKLAVSLGFKVSLGHTNASLEILQAAIHAGATGFTHLANGCPRELDRHDNILWRVCALPGLTVSMIPDGIHVSPIPFRLLHRLLEQHKVIYTTDAMAAAGAGPGRYRLGGTEVEVGMDQVVRQPGKTNFAGSALRPVEGAFRAAQMTHRSWVDSWSQMSEKAARFAGILPGNDHLKTRTFCLVEVPEYNVMTALRVFVQGRELLGQQ